jgi:hypothetical protein
MTLEQEKHSRNRKMDSPPNKMNESRDSNDLINVTEFSAISTLARQTIYNRIDSKTLWAKQIGGLWLLSRTEAEQIRDQPKKMGRPQRVVKK